MNADQVKSPAMLPADDFQMVERQEEKSPMMASDQARAIQEVQAALTIAKRFPRDINLAYTSIMDACKRLELAEMAIYKYPRGGEVVTGPSIRLLEVVAQHYGNIDFGVRELDRRQGVSICEAYCWDMQSNSRSKYVFDVPHEIQLKSGVIKKLTDPRDIREAVANQGARFMRTRMEAIIPGDLISKAERACKETIAAGKTKDGVKEPLIDRLQKMVVAFKDFGVTLEMIEGWLEHKLNETTSEEFVELYAVYNGFKSKELDKRFFGKTVEPVKSGLSDFLDGGGDVTPGDSDPNPAA